MNLRLVKPGAQARAKAPGLTTLQAPHVCALSAVVCRFLELGDDVQAAALSEILEQGRLSLPLLALRLTASSVVERVGTAAALALALREKGDV